MVNKRVGLHLVRKPPHVQLPHTAHSGRFWQPSIHSNLLSFFSPCDSFKAVHPTILVLGQRRDVRTIYAFARIVLPSPLTSVPSALLRLGLRDASSFAASRAHVSTRSLSSCLSFLPPTGWPPQLANLGQAPATTSKSNSACCQALRCCASFRVCSVAHSRFGKPPGFLSGPAASSPSTFCLFGTAPEHLGACPCPSYGPWQRIWMPLEFSGVEPKSYDLDSFGR